MDATLTKENHYSLSLSLLLLNIKKKKAKIDYEEKKFVFFLARHGERGRERVLHGETNPLFLFSFSRSVFLKRARAHENERSKNPIETFQTRATNRTLAAEKDIFFFSCF